MTEINNNSFVNNEEESTFNLLDLWDMIWGHKWWYVACVALCLVAAGFYLYRTPDTYVRTVKVMVDESEQDAAMRNLGVVSAGAMRLRSFNSVENEIEAFASPDLMQTVVERLDLQTRYVEKQFLRDVELYQNSPVKMHLAGSNPQTGFNCVVSRLQDGRISLHDFTLRGDKIKETVTGSFGDTLVTPVGALVIYPQEEYLEDFTNDIVMSWANSMAVAKGYSQRLNISLSGKESSVIVISLNDRFPARSSAVLSSLVDVYNEVWIANKNRSAINTAEFINERLIIIERDLSTVEQSLRKYKADNNLTDIKATAQSYIEESTYYATKAFEVNNQLSIASFIKEYLSDPAKAEELIPSNLGLTSNSVELQIKEYNEILLQRDRLKTGSGANNPLIADMNASLASIRTAILGSVNNLITSLELQKGKLDSQEKQILSRMSSSSGQELQLMSLQRQQKITQDLYVYLLEKREENELASLINVGNTRMIMKPNGPSEPVSPNKLMVLFAAIVLGMGIPFAFFFLTKMLDTTIKTKSDLDKLSVPFLAEIPQDENISKKTLFGKHIHSAKNSSRIIVEHGKRNMMNEAFRVFRTNIDLMIGKDSGSQVIMFTSFNPDAGKTFTLMNISASMALKGAKVLMIDLDLRKASLSKCLADSKNGVASYLNGKCADYHKDILQITSNLSVLPVGSMPPNPTELLLVPEFASMIAELRKEYDYIFLDCPPIDIVADASIITAVADLSIFVLRADLLDKKVLPQVEALYKSGRYNHMALILNGVDMQFKKYGYGSRGRFGYGYGYGE
ncbi:MAG: polysaccharide biosynthesis tyrosine autokinase [Bacteroidales bacterium]|nr:polysaccharide biosynthesis tyrosine autokinase [Bacteroidales bacterium]